jgi:hypothetical protein
MTATNKTVRLEQKAIDALPLDSGTWRVAGIPGLYLRSRARSKSFFLQRRVNGLLVKETLGELTAKEAKAKAMRSWDRMRPKPRTAAAITLGQAVEQYLDAKTLADKTKHHYRYNLKHYLSKWKDRTLQRLVPTGQVSGPSNRS